LAMAADDAPLELWEGAWDVRPDIDDWRVDITIQRIRDNAQS
jgi:hypothetical protein